MNTPTTDVDFIAYHQSELPRLLDDGGNELAARAAAGLPPLAIQMADSKRSFSYIPCGNKIEIREGCESATTVVELDSDIWQALVVDLETVPGIVYGAKLGKDSHGDLAVFADWEPVLRSIYHGLPVYDPESFVLKNSKGETLDPEATFELNDSLDDMAEFLDAAGYLVINNVFNEQELADFRQQAEELREEARPNDKISWWGKNTSGEEICTRVLLGGTKPAFSGLYEDERVQRIQKLLPEGASPCEASDVDGVTVVYKTPDMVEGLSNLPWHRDCGMGGHALKCPACNFSIYLYDPTREAGELRFMPGSHKASYGNNFSGTDLGVAAPAKAGSVTLHATDVMHAAPPPTSKQGPFRTSVLLSFKRKEGTHRGERHYNDVLLGRDDGQIDSMQDMLKK